MVKVIDVVEAGEQLKPAESVAWWDLPDVVPPSVCNVHRGTGEFMGVSPADPSPLEPGVWVDPAHSYRIAPPDFKAGFAALINRDSDGWDVVADHRGATVHSTETGEPRQWLALGDLPEGYTLQAPETKFDAWKDGEWVLDEAARAAELTKAASRKKSLLAQYSASLISTLQNAVDLEMATAAEVEALKAWKVYGVYLNRVEPGAELTPGDWPASPNDTAVASWLGAQGFVELEAANEAPEAKESTDTIADSAPAE